MIGPLPLRETVRRLADQVTGGAGAASRIQAASRVARTAMYELGEVTLLYETSVRATAVASEELQARESATQSVPDDVVKSLSAERSAYLQAMEELSRVASGTIVRLAEAHAPHARDHDA